MSKIQKSILNVLTLVLLNTLFFIGNIYPKHILEFQSLVSIVSTLLNLIFTVAFDYFLIIVFNKNKTLFSNGIWDKTAFKQLYLLVFLHIVFDGLLVLASNLPVKWASVITSVLVVLQWAINYVVITRKTDGILTNHKASICVAVAFILIIVCSILCDISIFAEYDELIPKYKPESPILAAVKTNTEFLFSVKLFITDTAVGALLILTHICTRKKESNPTTKFSVLTIRITVLIAMLLSVALLKVNLWPYGALVAIDTNNVKNENFENMGPFNIETESTKIYRYSSAEVLCYSNYNVRISKTGNELYLTDTYIRPYTYNFRSVNGNVVPEYTSFAEFDVGTGKAYLYDSQVICFYKGDTPISIKLCDLSTYERNDTVIRICRETLKSGNVYIFEHCVNYLSIYDKDFIDEYIQRYSDGNFSETEKEWMTKNHYREEYLTAIANSCKREMKYDD